MRRRTAGSKKYLLSVLTEGDATVTVNGITQTSLFFGVANFYLKKGSYSYSVSKSGFYSQSGTVTVNGDTEKVVNLERIPPAYPPWIHLPLSENADDISGNNRVVDAYNVSYQGIRAEFNGIDSYINTGYVIQTWKSPVSICFKCMVLDASAYRGHVIVGSMPYTIPGDWPSYCHALVMGSERNLELLGYQGRDMVYNTLIDEEECDIVLMFTSSYAKVYINKQLTLSCSASANSYTSELFIGKYNNSTNDTTEMTVRDFKIYEGELSESDIINGIY